VDLLNDFFAPPPGSSGGGGGEILERNLAALALRSPAAAAAVRASTPALDAELVPTREDAAGLLYGGRTLASRVAPVTEAGRLAETVDPTQTAAVCLLGFAAGHHVRAIVERLGRAGVVVCFEPDTALLRSVLSAVDHSGWLAGANMIVLTNADDRAAISSAIAGSEGLMALGVKIIEHAPSAARLAGEAQRFADRFTEVVQSLKAVVATTLVQSETTLRNLLMNADAYAAAPGLGALAGAASGRVGIVVAAGPSLERNIEQLARPEVRERAVLIAAQTVLRPLLRRGIRPRFVTALDYHEISARFYEGLTAEDVDGVTLVADPKVNPAVLAAWPGAVMLARSELLDELLGNELAGEKAELKPGATVAHLSCYLARFLGCDPVVLVGQDLGFTDGQYYGAGAAIHDTWACEIGPFTSLECMEWQRIARAKRTLKRRTDDLGRAIFTDDQMASYLAQFEQDFAEAAAAGLRTIDATEGGVAKQHTTRQTLRSVVDTLLGEAPPLTLPEVRRGLSASAAGVRAAARCGAVARDAQRMAEQSRRTAALLGEIAACQSDQARVNRLIGQIHAIRDEVTALGPAYRLTQFIDQIGALQRVRADRAIDLAGDTLSPLERQRRQLERDRVNVERLAAAAERLAELLTAAERAMLGHGPRMVRDSVASETPENVAGPRRVAAVVLADPDVGGLGTRRDLSRTLALGLNPLRLCVARLLTCGELDAGVVVLATDVERVRALLGPLNADPRVRIEPADEARSRARRRAVGHARLFSPGCWRGGVAGMTAADECCDPESTAVVMQRLGLDAAALVGGDWALVDPALVDEAVRRHRARPEAHRLAFTQAPPGLAAYVADRRVIEQLADGARQDNMFASFGALLGYVPVAPQRDPIGTELCIAVEPIVRDCGLRCVPDSPGRTARLALALRQLGDKWLRASAGDVVRILDDAPFDDTPQRLTLELCSGRLAGGRWGAWLRGSPEPVERPVLTLPMAYRVLRQLVEKRDDAALTLHGIGDPLMHPRALELVRMARELGFAAVHLRTDLLHADEAALDALLTSGIDVLSVDVLAHRRETYRTLAGVDRLEHVRGGLSRLLDRRRGMPTLGGLPATWIVPRLTRCDEVVEEIPDFFDAWTMAAGAAAIDPLPRRVAGARIAPFPLPRAAAARLARAELVVLSDGSVVGPGGRVVPEADLILQPIDEVWRRVLRARRAATESRQPTAHAGAAGAAGIVEPKDAALAGV
jgi:hypothetical protein